MTYNKYNTSESSGPKKYCFAMKITDVFIRNDVKLPFLPKTQLINWGKILTKEFKENSKTPLN